MRLRRLALIRYGPFTDRSLDFRDGAALHLVHGANEAGKSVALSALSDLLFGFPHVVGHDWLHPAGELRLGAEIAGDGGRRLAFRRRRGRAATLRSDDAAEAALPEDALDPFLRGLTRATFERAFGLDAGRLAEGARLMLDPEGGGGALFAAASGLTGVLAAQRALAAEAEGIYARRRARDRRFYQALDAWEAAGAAERAATLGEAEWRRLNTAVEDGQGRLAALAARRLELARERERLGLVQRLRPLLAAAAEAEAAVAVFSDLAALPEGLGAALAAAQAEAARTAAAAGEAAAAHAAAAAEVAAVAVDEALLARGEAVTALFSGVGGFRKHAADLPRVAGEEAGRAAELAGLARRLGVDDGGALAAAQPADAALAALEAALDAGVRLRAALDNHQAAVERAAARLDGDELPEPPDPAPWARALEALGPDLERLAGGEAREGEAAKAAAAIAARRAALAPPLPAAADLAALALPDEAARAAAAAAVAAAEAAARAAEADLERLAAARAAAAAELEEAGRAGPLPTRGAIAAARGARDDALGPLLDAVGGGAPPGPAAASFRGLVAAADRLADAALTEAGRVARAAAAAAALEGATAAAAAAEGRRAAARAAAAAALDGWAAALAPAGVRPAPPAAMQGWLVAAADLRDRARALAALAAEQTALARLADGLAAPLAAIEAGLGGLAGGAALAPAARARALFRRIGELATARRGWETAAAGRAEARRLRAQAEAARTTAQGALDAWQGRLRAALAAAGLDRGLAPEAARAAVAAWRELPPLLRERASLRARVAGMRRDMDGFAAEAGRLAAALAPDLAALAPDAVAEALNRRLAAAQAAAATRAARAAARDGRARAAAAAAESAAVAAAAARRLGEGLPEGADPAALAARLQARDAAVAAAAQARRQIALVAPDGDDGGLAAAVAATDAAAAALRLEAIGAEDAARGAEERDAHAALRDAERARDAAADAEGAEVHAFARAAAEAAAAAAGRDWLVRSLAARMLARLVEGRRAAASGALLARAGALFARLTAAAFAGLGSDLDADGRPHLLARRAGGTGVRVAELSEGTRDQLFLALRLAALEEHAAAAGPMPLIADDLFQSFDDDRAAAGLAVLAEAGRRFQVILFTHHEAIVAAAGRAAGDGLDLIRL